MKKVFMFLSCFLCFQLALAENNIPLVKNDPLIDPEDDPRSIVSEVTATIDDQVVTVSFSELTASQIVVTDSADQTVFNQTYPAAYSALADLTSLAAGSYIIHIYAYGSWWYGYLVLQ